MNLENFTPRQRLHILSTAINSTLKAFKVFPDKLTKEDFDYLEKLFSLHFFLLDEQLNDNSKDI